MTFEPETPLAFQPLHSHAVGDRTIAMVAAVGGAVLVSCLVGTQPG
jgi:hypothetical protein